MCLTAGDRTAGQLLHVARAYEAAHSRKPRRSVTCLDAVGPTNAEVGDVDEATSGDSTASCFRGDCRLEGALVEEVGLDKLCLGDRCRYLEERFVSEHNRALGHRPHITCETKRTKAAEVTVGKADVSEILEVGLVEGKLLEKR